MYFSLHLFLPCSLIYLKVNTSLEKNLTRLQSVRSTLSHISFLDLDILYSRFLSIIRYTISKIFRFFNFLVIKELMRQLTMFFILGIMIYGNFQLGRGLDYPISIVSLPLD